MLRRKVKTSLTARIFFVTTLILLAASAVTFGIIALFTPWSYTSVLSDRLIAQSKDLAATLEGTPMEESGPVLDRFILDTGASVVVTGPDGNILDTPSALATKGFYDADGSLMITTATQKGVSQKSAAYDEAAEDTSSAGASSAEVDAIKVGTATTTQDSDVYMVSTDQLTYTFVFQDWEEPCTLTVTPRVEKANSTLLALGRVAPWLLAAMLAFSLLCALFYSRYITRPIVRLSGISRRLAQLDFNWTCGETRPDEIGVLGRSLDELSERLSSALGELREANAALKRDIDRERELEQQRLTFFSAASHELKTPVTILKGQLTGMLEGVDVYRDRDKYLARSLAVTGRMESLIQEILAVSRMEQASFTLRLEPVDLGALLHNQAELLSDLARQREQAMEIHTPSAVVVPGDRALLSRAVSNLLSNAILYSPQGSRIAARLEEAPAGTRLTVDNGGVHIPEEAIPHLFEAFYRVESSRNRATGGSGLGLYLVGMILDRHGAGCQVENTPAGVRFTVTFPTA